MAQPTTRARAGVQHDGEVEEAGPGRHIGDVRHPELVRRVRVKLRSTRSQAGRTRRRGSWFASPLRRLTPARPLAFISRATRLRPTWMPSSASSAWTRGAP